MGGFFYKLGDVVMIQNLAAEVVITELTGRHPDGDLMTLFS